MQTLQILPSLHKQHGLGNKSRFARFKDLQKYDLSESRKKEVIKHTKLDIEQKEVHDYLPGVYSEVDENTWRGLPFLC